MNRNWIVTGFIPELFLSFRNTGAAGVDNLGYLIYQVEQCPTTNNLHCQAYFEFDRTVRFSHIKKIIGDPNLHCEVRRGTQEEAIKYCSKVETRVEGPWEIGVPSKGQGNRKDLEVLRLALASDQSMEEVADANFANFLRYPKSFYAYRTLKRPDRSFRTELYIHYGLSGTGKSHDAYHPGAYYLRKGNGDAVWFDGYEGQEIVVIDDFYGWIPWSLLLNLADCYPLTVDTKGGHVKFTSKRIYITSNAHPSTWYPRMHDKTPLYRRVTKCIHYESLTERTEQFLRVSTDELFHSK